MNQHICCPKCCTSLMCGPGGCTCNVQEDTMGVIGKDGKKYHLYRTRKEEDEAIKHSPLSVALSLVELAKKVGAVD